MRERIRRNGWLAGSGLNGLSGYGFSSGDPHALWRAIGSEAEVGEREKDVQVLEHVFVMDSVMLFHKLKDRRHLKAFVRRNVHEVVEVLIDEIVSPDGCEAAPHAWDMRQIFNDPHDRSVKAEEQKRSEPVHSNMIFVRIFFFPFFPLIGVRLIFVDLMMHDRVRLKGGLDEFRRVKKVLVENPFKETSVEEVEDESKHLAQDYT